MAVTIQEKPFTFDFAGNRTRFLLRGTPVSTNGRRSVSRFVINTLPSEHLAVRFGNDSFEFAITTPAQARNTPNAIANYSNTASLRTELISKIAENYYISRLYDVVVDEDLALTFTSKDYGGDIVSIDDYGSGDIDVVSQIAGIARVEKPNYQVFARFEITRHHEGGVQTIESPEMLLHPGSDNIAELPVEILRSYFSAADVPSPTETYAAHILQYATLKYRLTFSDVYGDNPAVGVLKHSAEMFLSAGCSDEEHRSMNRADWVTGMGANKRLSEYTDIRNYGCDSGLIFRSFRDMPQYAYFMLFASSKPNTYSRNLTVNVTIRRSNGTTLLLNPGVFTITNYNIVRMPLSVAALGLSAYSQDILSYSVHVSNALGEVWTRTFVLESKPYGAQVFLLQNRYGVLESLYAETESLEERTEGGETVQNGIAGIDITDRSTIHTARTGYRGRRELQLVADAMRGRFNYRIVDGKAVPISVIPDTLTVKDDEEDLLSAEFRYRFNTPLAGHGTSPLPINPDGIEIWEDTEVWRDSAHSLLPPTNIIANQFNKSL